MGDALGGTAHDGSGDEAVDADRLGVIDGEDDGGARLYGAMRDQELRAHLFEKQMRWMRLRRELHVETPAVVDLRDGSGVGPVTPT